MKDGRILVITPEPLPLPGQPTNGAGLRAWGLAEGLRSRGFDAHVASWVASFADPYVSGNQPLPAHVHIFRRDRIGELIAEVAPSVLVLQHWGLAREIPELDLPIAMDLAGPHLLERLFWGETDVLRHAEEKLEALRRADFFVCSGEHQRHYFYAWLTLAGLPPTEIELPVIPFSVPPYSPPPATSRDWNAFVYGGLFLAWQDPTAAIRATLQEMSTLGRGTLHLHVGAHPALDASGGRFAQVLRETSAHSQVRTYDIMPFEELVAHYVNDGVALDLMAWNCERELAFTTRTMIYLWCGLPVIHDDYSELGRLIREARCGWALNPQNEIAVRQVVRDILSDRIDLAAMSRAAREFAERYTWDKTIGPLAEFCANPQTRHLKTRFAMQWEAQTRELVQLRNECAMLRADLDRLRGNWLVRVAERMPRLLRRVLAPALRMVLWPIARWIEWRLKKTAGAPASSGCGKTE